MNRGAACPTIACAPSEDSDQSNQILYCPRKDALDPWLSKECSLKTLVRYAHADLSFRWAHICCCGKYCAPDHSVMSTYLVSKCHKIGIYSVQVLAFTKSSVYA